MQSTHHAQAGRQDAPDGGLSTVESSPGLVRVEECALAARQANRMAEQGGGVRCRGGPAGSASRRPPEGYHVTAGVQAWQRGRGYVRNRLRRRPGVGVDYAGGLPSGRDVIGLRHCRRDAARAPAFQDPRGPEAAKRHHDPRHTRTPPRGTGPTTRVDSQLRQHHERRTRVRDEALMHPLQASRSYPYSGCPIASSARRPTTSRAVTPPERAEGNPEDASVYQLFSPRFRFCRRAR